MIPTHPPGKQPQIVAEKIAPPFSIQAIKIDSGLYNQMRHGNYPIPGHVVSGFQEGQEW
jgi:hypothetical protein